VATRAPSLCCEARRGYARHLGTSYKHSFFFSNWCNTPQYDDDDDDDNNDDNDNCTFYINLPLSITPISLLKNHEKRITSRIYDKNIDYQQDSRFKIFNYVKHMQNERNSGFPLNFLQGLNTLA
jgi:hypothetical protein